jgi:hypothetical protein
MKKIMGLVLGLSLAVGAFSFALAQGGGNDTTKGSGKDTTKSN